MQFEELEVLEKQSDELVMTLNAIEWLNFQKLIELLFRSW
jgi:hypothetical protein